jgi:hypothetical protein
MIHAKRRLARALARLTLGLALAGALILGAPAAAAKGPKKAKVVWTEVVVREGKDRPRLEQMLRPILEKEGKRAKWGKGRDAPVQAEIHVKELTTVVTGDVVRVTCSAVGKIKGVGLARSKFSYGGKPANRAALEKHVVELVARGIITRLSEMARTQQEQSRWHVAHLSREPAALPARLAPCPGPAPHPLTPPCPSLLPGGNSAPGPPGPRHGGAPVRCLRSRDERRDQQRDDGHHLDEDGDARA